MSLLAEKELTCAACGSVFAFNVEEQTFYASKGFQDPKKCKPCRDAAKQSRNSGYGYSGGDGYGSQQRQLHPATCAACGVETQVPFVPNGTKPVYCRDCYRAAY